MITSPILDPACNPFAGMDVRVWLEGAARRGGDKMCLVWEPFDGATESWTYTEFVGQISRFGAGLYKRGIRRGDTLILHMDNAPEQLVAWLGCAWIGAVAVTTNAKSSLDELTYFAAKSKARAAITQPVFADLISEAMPDADWIAVTRTNSGDPAEAPGNAFLDFEALSSDPGDLPASDRDCSKPFGIQFTSGTTSRPKGVVWTHANALWGAQLSAFHEGLTSSDVHLVYLPLFHTNAQVYSVLATLWAGGTIVLQPRFSASRFWPVSLKHGCTWSSMVPFMVQALLKQDKPDTHSYRFWGNGVCDIPTDSHFGVRTLGWWGMTETITHGIVGSVHDKDLPKSMGRPSIGYQIGVFRDDGQRATTGETGDLRVEGVRGLSLFLEYLDDESATAASFDEEGWFLTGDRVTLAENGWLVFADRAKDMLKVGGENVAASEVERVIASLDFVHEVAVVGRPDTMLNEVPVAFVKLTGAEQSIKSDLADQILTICKRQLAAFKVPHEVIFISDFPRATLNKIAKAELKKQLVIV